MFCQNAAFAMPQTVVRCWVAVQVNKPPKTMKETDRWVKDFLDDTYREDGAAASRFANTKRVRELVTRSERLLHKVSTPLPYQSPTSFTSGMDMVIRRLSKCLCSGKLRELPRH